MNPETKRFRRGRALALGLVIGLAGAGQAAVDAAAQNLVEALSTAYDANPTLLAARATVRIINEGVSQELSNWRPNVTVSGTAGKQRIDSTFQDAETTTPIDAQISVQQFVYRGGRTLAGTRRAEAEVQAERSRLTSTEQLVLLSAATAYMDVWRDQAVLQLNINNEQVLQRQLEASQDRFSVGEITMTDVAQAESRLARATATRIAAEGNLTASRAVFQEVVGLMPGILEAPDPVRDLPTTQESVVGTARQRNPDVLAASFSEEAARNNVRQAFGRFLPELSLTGSVEHSEEVASGDSETDRARILAQVTVPLYQQGFVSSQVRAAKQQRNQRRLQIDEARRRAEQLAISAWENLLTARAQIESFRSEVRAAEIALEGVRQEHAVGARTVLDILDAEQELLDAQVSLVRSERDEVVAGFEVLTAMGHLTARDLGLPVELYDPEDDYRAVRDRWYGIGIPGE